MFFKIGPLKNFTNFTEKHFLSSQSSVTYGVKGSLNEDYYPFLDVTCLDVKFSSQRLKTHTETNC